MVTVSYRDLYAETQPEGGVGSCKYLLKDIKDGVIFTAMNLLGGDGSYLWHQIRQNKIKREFRV